MVLLRQEEFRLHNIEICRRSASDEVDSLVCSRIKPEIVNNDDKLALLGMWTEFNKNVLILQDLFCGSSLTFYCADIF